MSKVMKKRLKSYHFWVYVSAFILLVANTLGLSIVEEEYNKIVNGLLGLLVMLGVLTTEPVTNDNPDTKNDTKTPPTDM